MAVQPVPGNYVTSNGYGPFYNAGAPVAGTNAVNTLTLDATGGTFKLAFDGYTTSAITWVNVNATLLASIQAALDALPNLGASWVVASAGTLTAGVGTVLLTFSGGDVAKNAVATFTVANNSLTGTATCSVAVTTPGVAATARNSQKGSLLIDPVNGKLYVNTGTQGTPTWTVQA